MYTREEASRLRQEFWTTFGQYMAPIPSAEGTKTNWINYKTAFKDLYFRMQADSKKAFISTEMSQKDIEIQEMFFEQFKAVKIVLEDHLQEEWEWSLHIADEYGKTISRIYTEIYGVNIFDRNCWPRLISFFKPRLIALDAFWADAKYRFDSLK